MDVAQILTKFGILNVADSGQHPAEKLLAVVTEAGRAGELVDCLFPDGVPLDESFFERLADIRGCVHFAKAGVEAVGYIWVAAFNRITPEEQQVLLDSFADKKCHDLYVNLDSLPVVLKEVELPLEFMAAWLAKLLGVVERDMAQGGFWDALHAFCAAQPERAVMLISILKTQPSPITFRILAYALGAMRGLNLSGNAPPVLERLNVFFRDHANPEYRSCFNSSWAATATHYGITEEQIAYLIERAERDEHRDANSLFGVICWILLRESIED